jgi:hypothetical protein
MHYSHYRSPSHAMLLPLMHAARWRALHDVVVSSVNGCALSLVGKYLSRARD